MAAVALHQHNVRPARPSLTLHIGLPCSAPAVAADPVNAVTGKAFCTKPATGGELRLAPSGI